ncbi:MAG TPA: LemA family protein [Clostridiaceae bacterium]|jgi:LemA protein|nr:LemA family protein [Clostridiaceae bacterium]
MSEQKQRNPRKTGIIVIVVIAVIIGGAFITYHNRFVKADEKINEMWGQVQTQYQRRADLIPNLVNTVKGYASHEEKVLTDLTELRSKHLQAETPAELESIDRELQTAINVAVEAYPDLKANQNFLALQDELAGTENRIAVSRKDYNTAVASYNRSVRTIPGKWFAAMFGYEPRPLFEAQPGTDTPPEVSF